MEVKYQHHQKIALYHTKQKHLSKYVVMYQNISKWRIQHTYYKYTMREHVFFLVQQHQMIPRTWRYQTSQQNPMEMVNYYFLFEQWQQNQHQSLLNCTRQASVLWISYVGVRRHSKASSSYSHVYTRCMGCSSMVTFFTCS